MKPIAVDVFELRAARQVWLTLTQEERDVLCYLAEHGELVPKSRAVDDPHGPYSRASFNGPVRFRAEPIDPPEIARIRDVLNLVALQIESSEIGWFDICGLWHNTGREKYEAYKLTAFGSVVARVGNALRIVGLALAPTPKWEDIP